MRTIKTSIAAILLFFMLLNNTHAQSSDILNSNINNWFFIHTTLKLYKHFTIGNELHIRRDQWLKNWNTFIERPYLTYHAKPNIDATIGYSYIRSWPIEPIPSHGASNEHNVWEQLILKQKIGKEVKVAHRYRLEHRFVDHWENIATYWQVRGTNFKNRFRYRLTITAPIVKFNDKQNLYLNFFDEMWINQRNSLLFSSFERNWLYGGIGFHYNKQGSVELAYMHQFNAASNSRFTSMHLMQLSISYAIALTKEETK